MCVAVLPFTLAVCPLPSHLLPAWGAAPLDEWSAQPIAVAGEQDAVLVTLALSLVLVLSGMTAAALRRGRLAAVLCAASFLSVLALGLTVTVLTVRWESTFAGVPSLDWIVFYLIVAVGALAAAAWLGYRAHMGLPRRPAATPVVSPGSAVTGGQGRRIGLG